MINKYNRPDLAILHTGHHTGVINSLSWNCLNQGHYLWIWSLSLRNYRTLLDRQWAVLCLITYVSQEKNAPQSTLSNLGNGTEKQDTKSKQDYTLRKATETDTQHNRSQRRGAAVSPPTNTEEDRCTRPHGFSTRHWRGRTPGQQALRGSGHSAHLCIPSAIARPCSVWATWRGMALSNRLLECLPVACQNPEPRERLALRRGRDDCHFWLHRVSLQGTTGSARAKEEKDEERRNAERTRRTRHLSGTTIIPDRAMTTFQNPVWRKVGLSLFATRTVSVQFYF